VVKEETGKDNKER